MIITQPLFASVGWLETLVVDMINGCPFQFEVGGWVSWAIWRVQVPLVYKSTGFSAIWAPDLHPPSSHLYIFTTSKVVIQYKSALLL